MREDEIFGILLERFSVYETGTLACPSIRALGVGNM